MSVLSDIQANSIVAKQFEDRGYVVIVEPEAADIAINLGNYRPDLLAVKDGENIVVEVKRAGSKVDAAHYLQVANRIAAHPGWMFQIVTLPASVVSATKDLAPVSAENVRARLSRLEPLLENEDLAEFALSHLWNAYVTVLRLVVSSHGEKTEQLSDSSLLNQAYSAGVLSFDELIEARRLHELRNETLHALEVKINIADVTLLKSNVEKLLKLMPSIIEVEKRSGDPD